MKWKKSDEMVHFNTLSTCSAINIHLALMYSVRLQNTKSLPSVSTFHLFFHPVLTLLGPLANSPSDSSSADSGGAGMDGSSSAETKQTKQIIPE
jgi:hypothetical protein